MEVEVVRIPIAVDGTEYSEEAIASVGSRIWPSDSEFMVVSVAEPAVTDLGGWVTDDTKAFHQEFIDISLGPLRAKLRITRY